MLKIDDVRDVNGEVIAQRVFRRQNFGIPFHAIFDVTGKLLIDSNGPVGNIGSGNSSEGKQHLRRMLAESRHTLTDAEIEQLIESVRE